MIRLTAGLPPMESDHSAVWKSASLAKKYLEAVREGIPLADEQLNVMLQLIEARENEIESFLDLGCGDGILSETILRRYPEAQGTLPDFSEPMLDAARQRLGNHQGRLRFVRADFGDEDWPLNLDEAAPFDVVVSGYSIHHQPDDRKQRIYKQIYGLLQSGGLFLNIEHVASPTPWVEKLSDERFVDSLTQMHRQRGSTQTREQVAAEYYHREDKAANILTPVEMQCQWLREIGFEDVDCYLKIFELVVFGGRRPS